LQTDYGRGLPQRTLDGGRGDQLTTPRVVAGSVRAVSRDNEIESRFRATCHVRRPFIVQVKSPERHRLSAGPCRGFLFSSAIREAPLRVHRKAQRRGLGSPFWRLLVTNLTEGVFVALSVDMPRRLSRQIGQVHAVGRKPCQSPKNKSSSKGGIKGAPVGARRQSLARLPSGAPAPNCFIRFQSLVSNRRPL
jgi:hypothetical protein